MHMGIIGSLMALAVSALLILGGLVGPSVGVASGSLQVSPRAALAQSAPSSAQAKTAALGAQAEDNGADMDAVEQGGQNGPDDSADVETANDGQDATPSGTPAIGSATAQQVAEAYLSAGPASKTELDDEDGRLVYSIEIGASDVKVDAMTGAILKVEDNAD